MSKIATTKLSSRGQVVIPEEIRDQLGLEPGVQFVVVGAGDAVILKTIRSPDMAEFESLLSEARASARRIGLKRNDVSDAIRRVRTKR